MSPKFKIGTMEHVYQMYLSGQLDSHADQRDSLQTAYKRGLAGFVIDYNKTSLTYAAWAAGRDRRKQNNEKPQPHSEGSDQAAAENDPERQGVPAQTQAQKESGQRMARVKQLVDRRKLRHPDEYEVDVCRLAKEAFDAAESQPTPVNARELRQIASILTEAGNKITLREMFRDTKP